MTGSPKAPTIVFMGTPEFAVPSLQLLAASKHSVIAVVTGPPKPTGRGRRLQPTPVQLAAEALDIPVVTVQDLKDPEFLDIYQGLKPDVTAVVAFRILPPALLQVPTRGTINLHGSLLPKYRGAAPIQRALMAGDTQTGLTTFLIDKRVDTGGMLARNIVDIHPDETFGDLSERMSEVGAELLNRTILQYFNDELTPQPQDDSQATGAPKIKPDDFPIDWSASAYHIHCQVRGLSPIPGATTKLGDTPVKILRSRLATEEQPSGNPGSVLLAHPKQGLVVQCGAGQLEILELMKAGKKATSGKQFVGGRQIKQFDQLT
jgi:methionyl-tRNA formyltransferase